MINPIQEIKQELLTVIKKGLDKLGIDTSQVSIEIERPKDSSHGDFACNIAMQLAKSQKCAPRELATRLQEAFDLTDTSIASVDIAGPGFINFTLQHRWLHQVLATIQKEQQNYGRVNVGKQKRVMVEFISANPTGPMHVGNARGGAIGDCLASILDHAGYEVTREFYVNDAGNQMERFGLSLEARYMQLLQGEDSFPFPEDGYHGEDITELMRRYIDIHGDIHVNQDSQERRATLIAFGLKENIESIQKTMEDFGIHYDVWFFESELYKNKEVEHTISLLKEAGYTYEQEGALWFTATKFGAEKDEVLIRSNGIPTYFAADIAYHRNKFITREFDTIIDVWGADHHGHTSRMKGAMDILGIDPNRLDFVLMQLVRLMRGGEIVRVSKRTGKAVTLNELLEDIGSDAARFFFNMRQPSSHFDFDLDLAVAQTNDNPVYYVQYAFARTCSILRLLEAEGITVPKAEETDLSVLSTPQELDVLQKLAMLPQEITDAAAQYEPSKITRYAIDLASAFHTFYNADRVKSDNQNLMHARLLLTDCVRITLKNTLDILGVSAPERM